MPITCASFANYLPTAGMSKWQHEAACKPFQLFWWPTKFCETKCEHSSKITVYK